MSKYQPSVSQFRMRRTSANNLVLGICIVQKSELSLTRFDRRRDSSVLRFQKVTRQRFIRFAVEARLRYSSSR